MLDPFIEVPAETRCLEPRNAQRAFDSAPGVSSGVGRLPEGAELREGQGALSAQGVKKLLIFLILL